MTATLSLDANSRIILKAKIAYVLFAGNDCIDAVEGKSLPFFLTQISISSFDDDDEYV
jgi:hypothetical protein